LNYSLELITGSTSYIGLTKCLRTRLNGKHKQQTTNNKQQQTVYTRS